MPKKNKRKIYNGLPAGTLRQQRILEHLETKESGDDIPYFRDGDGRLKYFDRKGVNRITGEVKYGLNDLSSKLEREARYAAQQLELTPTLEMFKEAFGDDIGRQVFLDELNKSKVIFDNADPALYDIDHMGSKKFLYPHLARNLNQQLSVYNRSEGARQLTPEQEVSLRVLKNDLANTIRLQGPELTPDQSDIVMNRSGRGRTGGLSKTTSGLQKIGQRLNSPYLTIAQDAVTNLAELEAKGIHPMQVNTQMMLNRAYDEELTINTYDRNAASLTNGAKDRFEAAMQARQNGSKLKVNGIKLPELGISEFLNPPKSKPSLQKASELISLNEMDIS